MAVYRDQLAEVDRDLERGLLDAEQAEAARIEVKRRMLAAAGEPPAPEAGSSRPGRPLVSTLAVAALVPAAAFGLYLVLGMPQAPDRPLAARPAPAETARSPSGEPGSLSPEMSMEEAVALLASRLEADPRNLRGVAAARTVVPLHGAVSGRRRGLSPRPTPWSPAGPTWRRPTARPWWPWRTAR